MKNFRLWIKKPAVWIVAAAVVLCIAVGVSCAVAFGGRQNADSEGSSSVGKQAFAVISGADAPADAPDSAEEEEPAQSPDDPAAEPEEGADPEQAGEGTTSYTAEYPVVVDQWRYQGMYPGGIPILTEAQVKSVTPGMTWRQIYEGFGLQKAFSNGIVFGVEGNRLLLLDWSDPDAPCGYTGAELLDGCLDLWREDSADGGRFVTFSDAAGLLLYDPESGRILFGEWTVPADAGTVAYNTETGRIQYSPPASSAPPCIFDEDGRPLASPDIQNGSQGYAAFSSLHWTERGNGLLDSAAIERLTLLRSGS